MKQTNTFPRVLIFAIVLSATVMKAQDVRDQTPAMTPRQQSIVAISSLAATGDLANLSTALNKGLDEGLTIEETKEILVQLYAYCGFPRSLNAISTFMSVIEKRKAGGINDKQGKTGILTSRNADKYEQGRKTLESLTKMPQSKPAPGFGEFAPRIDAFLKEHLFADIFENDVLTSEQRELVTISALAAMPGVRSQLQSHIKIGLNTGLTENQLLEAAGLIEKHISRTQANTLRETLGKPEIPVVEDDIMVRISEIEILPEYLTEYNAILKEEAAASIQKEAGVLAIFPMNTRGQPTQIRIIEIYANSPAYQSHLKTSHFQHYKTTTLKMVKSLKLVDMEALDRQTMLAIFEKLK